MGLAVLFAKLDNKNSMITTDYFLGPVSSSYGFLF